ncbi:MAG: hypothetical protein ACHQSE_14695 [Gemmatimonadales bacterium]
MRQLFHFALLLALAAGCSDSTSPRLRSTLLVQPETLTPTTTVAGPVQWLQFTIPAAVHNTGNTSLDFAFCDIAIQARTADDQWRTVWNPTCAVAAESTDAIQPAQTRQFTVQVAAALSGPGGPVWGAGQVEGTYRLQIGLTDGTSVLTITSNDFMLAQSR